MDASFYLLAVITLVESVTSISDVMWSNSSYQCCESPKIKFDSQRDHVCSVNGMNIALFNGEKNKCMPPCLEIKDGLMTLNQCIDVNVTTTWINAKDETEEERIYYHGQPCSHSVSSKMAPENQGSVGVLLAVVILGLRQMIS